MNRIFINTHNGDSGWILRILIEDIQREAEMLGYECNFGDYKDYKGEDLFTASKWKTWDGKERRI